MKARLAVIILLFSLSMLGAQISQSLVDADTLTVGARFQLLLKADFPLDSVTIPDSLDGFSVLGKDRIEKRGLSPFFRITLAPLKTGALSFPPLKVSGNGKEYSSNGFRINVLAVRAEQDSTLRDLKPLRRYPLQRPLWLYAILPLLLIAYLIWILNRRQKPVSEQSKPALPGPPRQIVPPWEAALRELAALESENLLQTGDYLSFHFELSMILRRFMELQYRIGAREMTTFEIREALSKLRLDESSRIYQFLLYCDRIKFAKAEPSPEEIETRKQWLRQYLESFSKQVGEHADVSSG